MNIPLLSPKMLDILPKSVRYLDMICRIFSLKVSVTSTPKELGIYAYAYIVTLLYPTVFHTVYGSILVPCLYCPRTVFALWLAWY